MTPAELVARLAGHRVLGTAPPDELEWLASRGQLRRLDTGEVLTSRASGRVEGMFILLSGHVAITADLGGGRRKLMEWRGGDVSGLLPYSRLVVPPADSVAEEPTEILVIHRDELPAMILDCHAVTSILVHEMVDRARQFTSNALHDEKMVSLGKLAAGLAHELNNPASAVSRSAKLLASRLASAEAAARALGAARLGKAQLQALDDLREACLSTPVHHVRSPLEQADWETTIGDWLETHGADPSVAEPLAESAVTLDALDRLPPVLEGATLDAALRWVATTCSVRGLAQEIDHASARISGLVAAVKGFTHMDQGISPQPVDVGQSLGHTLAVLSAKARHKSVSVVVDVPSDLPAVQGFVGELNQIWANLIDNALDAAPEAGRVEVTAQRDGAGVVVHVVDDGPGIPADVRERIFDPFFTTKPVGSGTGLGLDIARRLVRRHNGEIDVESRPGRTEFRVRLPLDDSHATGRAAGVGR